MGTKTPNRNETLMTLETMRTLAVAHEEQRKRDLLTGAMVAVASLEREVDPMFVERLKSLLAVSAENF